MKEKIEQAKKRNNLITKIRNKLRKDKFEEAKDLIDEFKNSKKEENK